MTSDADPGEIRIDRKYGGVVLIKQGDDEVVVLPAILREVAHVILDYAIDRHDFEHHIERRYLTGKDDPAMDTPER